MSRWVQHHVSRGKWQPGSRRGEELLVIPGSPSVEIMAAQCGAVEDGLSWAII